jgi:hypothetical protein
MPETLVENDLTRDGRPRPASAFKRRKVRLPGGGVEYRVIRPVFRDIVDRLATGRNDGLVALDLDRAVRDPRDLEDLVDLVERFGVATGSVTGSLRLDTDADVTMARVLVAMANKASRDTARRVAASRERRALAGQFGGGRRPYGFEHDGVTQRESECAVIADCADKVIRGASLRSLARDLRERAVPTVTGRPWTAQTLKDVLVRPRNAGRMIYQGAVVGDAPWGPIVPGDVHDVVVARLTDPERRTNAGRAPRWLGSGLYECGICGDGTRCQVVIAGRSPRYRCRSGNHLARNAAHVDALVAAVAVERLAASDLVGLLAPPSPEVDVPALRVERQAINERLAQVGEDIVDGLLTREAGIAATRRGSARVKEIDRQLAAALSDDPLVPWLSCADPKRAWAEATLEERRQLVSRLMRVTILPAPSRGRGFDATSVRIEPA